MTRVTAHMVPFSMWQYSVAWDRSISTHQCWAGKAKNPLSSRCSIKFFPTVYLPPNVLCFFFVLNKPYSSFVGPLCTYAVNNANLGRKKVIKNTQFDIMIDI